MTKRVQKEAQPLRFKCVRCKVKVRLDESLCPACMDAEITEPPSPAWWRAWLAEEFPFSVKASERWDKRGTLNWLFYTKAKWLLDNLPDSDARTEALEHIAKSRIYAIEALED